MSETKIIECNGLAVCIHIPTLGTDNPLNGFEEFILAQDDYINEIQEENRKLIEAIEFSGIDYEEIIESL